jgi:sulfhydrogenase subunit delta
MARPTLAIWKFASCDGCQLSLLDCEDELLAVADAVDVAWFPEASSRLSPGPYDLSLVEGSITTPSDVERIRAVREASGRLVAIGACATSGGIQALRNRGDHARMMAVVYPRPGLVEALPTSTPLSDHVKVDFQLRGCPVDKRQLLEVIGAFVNGRRPVVPTFSTCLECKMRGTVCVMVARGTPCLGPATQAGCGALCPTFGRGCYGCFGPSDASHAGELRSTFEAAAIPFHAEGGRRGG